MRKIKKSDRFNVSLKLLTILVPGAWQTGKERDE